MSLKKLIREQTVGKKIPLATKVVTFNEGSEDEYQVGFRQPTRKDKKALMSKCIDPETGQIDMIDMQTWAVILLTVDPDDGKEIFAEGDYERLNGLPSDSWFDEFAELAISQVSGLNGEPTDPKE